jgi:hypothetical protein
VKNILRGKIGEKTNPIGAKTKNFSANAPSELYDQINSLARASGMNQGEYIRCILFFAAASKLRIPDAAKPYSDHGVIKNEFQSSFSSFEARKLSVGEVGVALAQMAVAKLSPKPQVGAPTDGTDAREGSGRKGKDDRR